MLNLLIFIDFIFLIQANEINFNNLKILRKLNQKEDIQRLNKIITIYNPFHIVSYISTITNKEGDLFITINSEENVYERLVYAIKSNGSNYFSDTDNKPYKIFQSLSYDLNTYPMLAFIKIDDKEYLLSMSHSSMFELFEFSLNEVYSQGIFQIIKYNSYISKNIFMSLNYYNNSDYILNAYVDKHDKLFLLQKLHFRQVYIPSRDIYNEQNKVDDALQFSSVTCFEFSKYIECLYVDGYMVYTAAIFNILDLELIYQEYIEDKSVRYDYLFSKCICIKNYVGAFIYFTYNNTSPTIRFLKFNIINEKDSIYELEEYRQKIIINSEEKYNLGYNYIYNDIIKMDENNLIYVNTKNESDYLMIITFKLADKSPNILLNYYKIDLKEEYKLRIYKDISIFIFNGLLGIGMTNYNFKLSNFKTYASYFIIGEFSINNITIQEHVNIFDEENIFELKISDSVDFTNNIFGYNVNEIKILSSLDENVLGFYLYSNNLKDKIESNKSISGDDIINFKLISELGAKLDNYVFEFEEKITEADYNSLISFSDSYKEYPSNDTNFESFYEPKTFSVKNGFINLTINYCYQTCKSCSYLGDDINHHCDTCSEKYPIIYRKSNSLTNRGHNCVEKCPDNYILIDNTTCIPELDKQYINNIIKLIGYENYKKLTTQIKEISDNQIIIKNYSNIEIYAYEIGEKHELFFLKNDLIYIDFINSNLKEILINSMNLDKDTNIYVLIAQYNNKKYINPVSNDFDFVILFENGNEISIDRNIISNISAPIINLELAKYNYAIDLREKGYDIYDKNSQFYSNVCLQVFFENNDIAFDDRKKEIFPNNIIIVKPNCEYKMVHYKNKRFICEYNIMDKNQNRDNEEIESKYYFDINKKNFIEYLSYYINYKILTCINLFFNLNNSKNNIGLIFSSIISFIIFILFLFVFMRGLPKIKTLMYNELPTKEKLKKIIKEKYSNKFTRKIKKRNKTSIHNPNKKKTKKTQTNSHAKITQNETTIFNKSKHMPILKLNDLSSSKSNVILNNDINNIIHNRNIKLNIKRNNKKLYTTEERSKKRLKKVGFTKGINSNLIYEDTEKESENINNYNKLTYKKAIKFDKRNLCQIFGNRILDKIELINILRTKEIKEIYLSKYFLFLLIDVTVNALLISDYVISYKFHHNGKIDFNIILVVTICSNFLSLFIEHYLSLLIIHEKVIERIKEINQEEIFLNLYKRFFRIIIFQIIIFLILSIILILFCFYYLVIFCFINYQTQNYLIKIYLISLAEAILIEIIIALIVSCSRKLGINIKNKFIYNTSKYIDNYI